MRKYKQLEDDSKVARICVPRHTTKNYAPKENKKSWKNLSLAAWMAAWDRYALAMAMIDMLEFNVAMRYKQVGCVLSVSRCVHVLSSNR